MQFYGTANLIKYWNSHFFRLPWEPGFSSMELKLCPFWPSPFISHQHHVNHQPPPPSIAPTSPPSIFVPQSPSPHPTFFNLHRPIISSNYKSATMRTMELIYVAQIDGGGECDSDSIWTQLRFASLFHSKRTTTRTMMRTANDDSAKDDGERRRLWQDWRDWTMALTLK